RGTRVVPAGADADVLMSLRHALPRQGLSVSMAWDAKQAVDLFDAVRPELVVLDLELPPRNGYELVVRLAGAIPVPSVVLVYGDGDDTAAGFAAALTRGAPACGLVPRGRPLADVAGHREAPPAEQLDEIAAGAAAPEDMLEPALAAVLEASHAGAGALCLFDQRHELLRLAAEVGLSDEGCKRLRQVRRGGMGGWDMPLHSLLNR